MNIYHFDKVDSTNTVAMKMAKDKFPTPYIITADFQRCGKGKRNRIWHSQYKENLLMSVALECKKEVWLYSFISGIAVSKVLEKYGFHIKLKWVNDLILNDKKLGGILCEICTSEKSKTIIIGIGINIFSSNLPEEIKDFATSLTIEEPSLSLSIQNLAQEIAEEIIYLSKEDNIISMWKEKIWGIGKSVSIEIGENENLIVIKGIVSDITDKGELKISCNGETKLISAGTIVY